MAMAHHHGDLARKHPSGAGALMTIEGRLRDSGGRRGRGRVVGWRAVLLHLLDLALGGWGRHLEGSKVANPLAQLHLGGRGRGGRYWGGDGQGRVADKGHHLARGLRGGGAHRLNIGVITTGWLDPGARRASEGLIDDLQLERGIIGLAPRSGRLPDLVTLHLHREC